MYKYLHFHKKITIKVSYNNDVSLQNALSLVSNFTLMYWHVSSIVRLVFQNQTDIDRAQLFQYCSF